MAAADVPAGATQSDSQANQTAITVTQNGDVYTLTASSTLNAFALDGSTKEWVILDIATDETDITNVSTNGVAYTATDVATATSYGLSAGHATLAVAFDDLTTAGIDIVFATVNNTKNPVTITIKKGV